MRQALMVLAYAAPVTIDINDASLANDVIPLYAVAVVIFATGRLLSMMFRGHRGLLRLQLTGR
ncbi:MAG TPA: hypothetical protein VGJ82_22600 [Thermoanaerobaculia bacterium]